MSVAINEYDVLVLRHQEVYEVSLVMSEDEDEPSHPYTFVS